MSLYGSMRTSVSGMNAQSSRLATIADNIANAGTAGYKRVETQFTSLVHERSGELARYESGGVATRVRQNVSTQGTLEFTTSSTDLAIQGEGFFMVAAPSGERAMTRAGSFVPDSQGHLVNAAGYALLGQPVGTPIGNDTELSPIDLASIALRAQPSSEGRIVANLDTSAPIIPAGDRPSDNNAGSESSARTSVLAYGARGQEILLDVHFTRTAPDAFEVAVFPRDTETESGPFPYGPNASGPLGTGPAIPNPLVVTTLSFDPSTGTLRDTSPDAITVPLPDPDIAVADWLPFEIDLSLTSMLATPFGVRELETNGHAPVAIDRVEIGDDGVLRAIYETGTTIDLYDIPLATVIAPDRLAPRPGNVYIETQQSGTPLLSRAGSGSAGGIVSGALEASTVDIASELTDMIQSQRTFTANSKVFQTGSELMDVIVNLKR